MKIEALQKRLQAITEAALPQYFSHSVTIEIKLSNWQKSFYIWGWCKKSAPEVSTLGDDSHMIWPVRKQLSHYSTLRGAVNGFMQSLLEIENLKVESEETITKADLTLDKINSKKEVQP